MKLKLKDENGVYQTICEYQTGSSRLQSVTDAEGRVTQFSYNVTNAPAHFFTEPPRHSLDDVTHANVPYYLLDTVTHPTGATSHYSYETSRVFYGETCGRAYNQHHDESCLSLHGYKQFFRISSRRDEEIDADSFVSTSRHFSYNYSEENYTGYPDRCGYAWDYSTTVSDMDAKQVTYRFRDMLRDDAHMLYAEETYDCDTLIFNKAYTYDGELTEEVDTTYGYSGNLTPAHYTYDDGAIGCEQLSQSLRNDGKHDLYSDYHQRSGRVSSAGTDSLPARCIRFPQTENRWLRLRFTRKRPQGDEPAEKVD